MRGPRLLEPQGVNGTRRVETARASTTSPRLVVVVGPYVLRRFHVIVVVVLRGFCVIVVSEELRKCFDESFDEGEDDGFSDEISGGLAQREVTLMQQRRRQRRRRDRHGQRGRRRQRISRVQKDPQSHLPTTIIIVADVDGDAINRVVVVVVRGCCWSCSFFLTMVEYVEN